MTGYLRALFAIGLWLIFSLQITADVQNSIYIDEEIEIEFRHIATNTREPALVSIIWFTCNQGEETIQYISAQKLAAQGYESYFPDMLSAHFFSPVPSSIKRVPKKEIIDVIQYFLQQTSAEHVFLVGGARSAIPVLKGLSSKNMGPFAKKLKGALLITPRISKKTPEPGMEPVYIDEAGLSTLPILILEGERTPNRWGLPHLSRALSRSGSRVETDIINGVRGFFYLRKEQTQEEIKMSEMLDQLIHEYIQRLENMVL